MILGDACSRSCRFCNIQGAALEPKQNHPGGDDSFRLSREPSSIREVVELLGLSYVVITSVTRDDLPDGGASQFAKTIECIHCVNKKIKIEVLIPDFQGNASSLSCVLEARPDVVGINIETVERLYKEVRPEADYRISLNLLSKIKEFHPGIVTKSSMMLGLGERRQEVIRTMEDLKNHHCDILTLGQYLAPSGNHYPVQEFVSMEQFEEYKDLGLAKGFKAVSSGPLVRSSYRAEEVYADALVH